MTIVEGYHKAWQRNFQIIYSKGADTKYIDAIHMAVETVRNMASLDSNFLKLLVYGALFRLCLLRLGEPICVLTCIYVSKSDTTIVEAFC